MTTLRCILLGHKDDKRAAIGRCWDVCTRCNRSKPTTTDQ